MFFTLGSFKVHREKQMPHWQWDICLILGLQIGLILSSGIQTVLSKVFSQGDQLNRHLTLKRVRAVNSS